ncbi:MAG: type II toxin-antitoxin system VapC family toxin [Desulfobacterales bacterium]|jgi:predicted nucleic acid-binding protein|nr:type II toxin-antitoxin system VapC family toxin [Desulfobacterales bacterium]
MKYLLDTCVISELAKPKASKKVVDFVSKENEENLYISTLTFGELIKGIEKLPESAKKDELYAWVENDLKERFGMRIIDINVGIAETWGKIQAAAEKKGNPMPAIDSLIAATGIALNLIVVTRNVADMVQSGVALFNPWE